MPDDISDPDRKWSVGWDGHELDQLRRLARLPLWQKLQWLEEMNRVIRHMRKQRLPGRTETEEDTKA